VIQQINLYKPEFRPKTLFLSFRHMLLGGSLVMVVCALLSGYLANRVQELNVLLVSAQAGEARMNQQIVELEKRLNQKSRDTSLQKRNDRLKETLSRGRELLSVVSSQDADWNDNVSMADVLAGLARQTRQGIWLKEIQIGAQAQLMIHGIARSPEQVPAYLKQLGQESIFRGMRFDDLHLTLVKETQALDFTLASEPVDEADPDAPFTTRSADW
jgi:MSHA biogenesis protein MshI